MEFEDVPEDPTAAMSLAQLVVNHLSSSRGNSCGTVDAYDDGRNGNPVARAFVQPVLDEKVSREALQAPVLIGLMKWLDGKLKAQEKNHLHAILKKTVVCECPQNRSDCLHWLER